MMYNWLGGFSGRRSAALSEEREQARQHAEALSAAKAKRNAALAEYAAAKASFDTRRMNEAHKSARHATVEVVRLEMGR